MLTIDAIHYQSSQPIRINCDGDRIQSVTPLESSEDSLPYVAPGLFDIQINGYGGIWFSSPDLTVSDVVQITQALVDRGIARYFPTLVTNSSEALEHGFRVISQACDQSELVAACVRGLHLEGPYISAEDGPRGAHPVQHVRATDIDEFRRLQEAAGGRIRLVTLGAEAGGAVPFIEWCRLHDVVVAIGHTGATPEQITQAIDAGAQLSTHFGNGAHGTLPRHPNYLWEQLGDERLWASVIADGWHIPDSLLRCVRFCKTDQHTVLTCDVSGFAGCPPGEYSEGDVAVEVLPDGRLVVAGQRQFLAGSGALTGECVVRMAHACDIPVATAVDMATRNPESLFDQPHVAIEAGSEATLTLFRLDDIPAAVTPMTFQPAGTIVNGKQLFPQPV